MSDYNGVYNGDCISRTGVNVLSLVPQLNPENLKARRVANCLELALDMSNQFK